MQRAPHPSTNLVIVTDPGPDPDDVKAILVAAALHRRDKLQLRAVIANGGGQAERRACLARLLLDRLGATDVPVGVGTPGRDYDAQPHEFRLSGVDDVDRERLEDGAALFERTLLEMPPASVTVVCISSLRDFADQIRGNAELVLSRVCEVAIQGGLELDSEGKWVPDTSVNNGFDMEGAAEVYSFCLAHGMALSVVSRNAVPLLPMQLARSFATRTSDEVMSYLADAQFLGLEGLWQKLCAGKLPARCSKQWYFETFCGVGDDSAYEAGGYEQLGGDADIVSHLAGSVKPYDVVALMTVLPQTRNDFPPALIVPQAAPPRPPEVAKASATSSPAMSLRSGGSPAMLLRSGGGSPHTAPRSGPSPSTRRRGRVSSTTPAPSQRLYICPEHCIDVSHVLRLLRDTYHEVVLLAHDAATAGAPGPGGHRPTPDSTGASPLGDPERGERGAVAAEGGRGRSSSTVLQPADALLALRAGVGAPPPVERLSSGASLEEHSLEHRPRKKRHLTAPGLIRQATAPAAPHAGAAPEPPPAARSRSDAAPPDHPIGEEEEEEEDFVPPRRGRLHTWAGPAERLTGSPASRITRAAALDGGDAAEAGGAAPLEPGSAPQALPAVRSSEGMRSSAGSRSSGGADGVSEPRASGGARERLASAVQSLGTRHVTPPAESGAAGGAQPADGALALGARTLERQAELIGLLEGVIADVSRAQRRVSTALALAGLVLLTSTFGIYAGRGQGLGGPYTTGVLVLQLDALSVCYSAGIMLALLGLQPTRSFATPTRIAALLLSTIYALTCGIACSRVLTAAASDNPRISGAGIGGPEVANFSAARYGIRWEDLWVAAVSLLCLAYASRALLRSVCGAQRHARALLRALELVVGVSTATELLGVAVRRTVLGWTYAPALPLLILATWTRTLVKGAIAYVLLRPSARAHVRRQVARCLYPVADHADGPKAVSPHTTAALAPLAGFGTRGKASVSAAAASTSPEASQLELAVRSAYASFRAVELNSALTLAAVRAAWERESPGAAADGAGKGPAGSFTRRRSWRVTPSSSARVSHDLEASVDADTPPTEPTFATHAIVAVEPGADMVAVGGAAAAEGFGADVFVVHAHADDPAAKAEALRAWAAREQVGSSPLSAWIDSVCVDTEAVPEPDRLMHALVSMHQCRRLLLLTGPAFADSLACATAVHSWKCLGRSLEDVSVALVVPEGSGAGASAIEQQIIASFDAFAVMYCALPRSEEDAARQVHAVELASPSAYNEAMRACVPLVSAAVAAAQAERRETGGATTMSGAAHPGLAAE